MFSGNKLSIRSSVLFLHKETVFKKLEPQSFEAPTI